MLCRGFHVAFRASIHSFIYRNKEKSSCTKATWLRALNPLLFVCLSFFSTAHVRLLGCADGCAWTQSNRKGRRGKSESWERQLIQSSPLNVPYIWSSIHRRTLLHSHASPKGWMKMREKNEKKKKKCLSQPHSQTRDAMECACSFWLCISVTHGKGSSS